MLASVHGRPGIYAKTKYPEGNIINHLCSASNVQHTMHMTCISRIENRYELIKSSIDKPYFVTAQEAHHYVYN